MKKLTAWAATWTVPQAIVVLGLAACVTALAISITMSDGWGKLVTWLSDGQHQALLLSLAAFLGALYHRALGLDPKQDAPMAATSVVHVSPPVVTRDPDTMPRGPYRRSQDGSAPLSLLGAVVFGAAAFALLHGCGAQLTDSQRSALAIETQRCIVNERQIADRTEVCTSPGACHAATEAEDRADLAAERMRCDATRAAIVDGGVP